MISAMLAEETQVEKRRFPRYQITAPVKYSLVHSKSIDCSSTLDISEGGICFLAGELLPRGSLVRFSIPVADEVFCIDGKATHSAFLPNIEFYRTGIEFQNPESLFRIKFADEVAQIKDYQKKLSKELRQDVSEREAAREWIRENAKHFSYLF